MRYVDVRRPLIALSLVLPLMWLNGCGGGADDTGTAPSGGATGSATAPSGGTPAPAPSGNSETAASGDAEPATAEGWGTLTGTVTLKGAIPELPPLVRMGQLEAEVKDSKVCAAHDVPDERLVVDADSKGIRNVVIYLRRKPKMIHPDLVEPDEKEVVFDQKDCQFLDHVKVVRIDQKLQMSNSDPMSHNTRVTGIAGSGEFNQIIPAGGKSEFQFSRRTSVPVPVACDIHKWMKASILPLDHPYGTTTDAKGKFTIEKIPAGIELEFRVWQESSGYVNSADGSIAKGVLKVTLQAGETTTKDFEIDVSEFEL